jgi:hypothetical protein
MEAADVIRELLDLLRTERAENVRLTNIILQHLGVSVTEGDTTVHVMQAGNQKIRVGTEPWPVYRARLEKQFRARAEELEPEVLDFKGPDIKEVTYAETNQRHGEGVHNRDLDPTRKVQEGLHDAIQK